MKKTKRILAMVLSVALMIGLLPVPVAALEISVDNFNPGDSVLRIDFDLQCHQPMTISIGTSSDVNNPDPNKPWASAGNLITNVYLWGMREIFPGIHVAVSLVFLYRSLSQPNPMRLLKWMRQ